jgi:hypothetical protein
VHSDPPSRPPPGPPPAPEWKGTAATITPSDDPTPITATALPPEPRSHSGAPPEHRSISGAPPEHRSISGAPPERRSISGAPPEPASEGDWGGRWSSGSSHGRNWDPDVPHADWGPPPRAADKGVDWREYASVIRWAAVSAALLVGAFGIGIALLAPTVEEPPVARLEAPKPEPARRKPPAEPRKPREKVVQAEAPPPAPAEPVVVEPKPRPKPRPAPEEPHGLSIEVDAEPEPAPDPNISYMDVRGETFVELHGELGVFKAGAPFPPGHYEVWADFGAGLIDTGATVDAHPGEVIVADCRAALQFCTIVQ